MLRNGVDLRLFRPLDRETTRRRLGLDGPTLISVGHLIERKGHHLIIEAMGSLPGFTLLIAGEGPERANLDRIIGKYGLGGRVRLLGARPHDELPELYGAADALILASSREGWANVLLEAMACGTPVVATPIWGNPEVVARPEAGILMRERSPSGIAEGVKALFAALPPREATRDYAPLFPGMRPPKGSWLCSAASWRASGNSEGGIPRRRHGCGRGMHGFQPAVEHQQLPDRLVVVERAAGVLLDHRRHGIVVEQAAVLEDRAAQTLPHPRRPVFRGTGAPARSRSPAWSGTGSHAGRKAPAPF